MNVRPAQLLLGLTCLAFTTASCTSTVSGTPSPAPSASSVPANSDVFAGLNACQIVEQITAGQGFGPGENISRRNECDVTKFDFGTYGLALDPVQGLTEFARANANVVTLTVNEREAMQANIPTGGCAIAVKVSEHARALVTVSMSRYSQNAEACSNAKSFAEKIEPLLPKGQ
ncbi:DUF3558 domain-containing protein [Amycolatopsis viridis]|uniref:DUF3558 domain-containing protein n=1 Tax=Amycolatopsis viridis TaxID=185678 RepID=A0ABX0SQ54_9PSEU|nr:DUF3558 domain-containing protein [Amycolatopsis viridis]NIH77545.1 hypothetical protein [Amycolatopsis viridis]